MKTTHSLIFLAAALFCNSLAFAGPDPVTGPVVGPAGLNVTGASQNLNYQTIRVRTNIVGMETNFTFVFKSTTTNFTVNAEWLLALLENSYHTNFPTGSKLLLTGGIPYYSFLVTDSTGTNFFDPYQVLKVSAPSASAHSGIQTDSTTNSSGNSPYAAGNDTESVSWVNGITYDDSAMTNTVDRTHTKFSCTCLGQGKFSESVVTAFDTESATILLIGSGYVRGQPNSIFTGTIRAKASGFDL